MDKLKINEEHFPQRCEICHQSDFFDAENNHCLRCYKVTREISMPEINTDNKKENSNNFIVIIIIFILTTILLISNFSNSFNLIISILLVLAGIIFIFY